MGPSQCLGAQCMNDSLLDSARRYAHTHADPLGIARPPIPGVTIIRATQPSGLEYAISRPIVCLVLQGSKRVTMGNETYAFGAGDSLLITADVPTVSQITVANSDAPYLSFVLDLELALMAELAVEMNMELTVQGAPVQVEPTDSEVRDSALRLIKLVERPSALPMLAEQRLREMHYWLLVGKHGPAIRQLGRPEGRKHRIARAVSLLRGEFAQPLPVERLAAEAGMSLSAFYQHFRSITSLTPLQFQKQLRLIEARRLMTTQGLLASSAAFEVGYESVQQFTREYRRMFGLPPGKDADAVRSAWETMT